jgi:formylglycine-generating enzyme required for sulfatase activity
MPAASSAADLVRVPSGELYRGSTPASLAQDRVTFKYKDTLSHTHAWAYEQGFGRVHIKGFWAQRTEVTVSDWKVFVQRTGYVTTAERGQYPAAWWYDPARSKWVHDRSLNWRRPEPGVRAKDAEPVRQVSRMDALTYAKWLSRRHRRPYRLPNEAEFEWMAWANSRCAVSPLLCDLSFSVRGVGSRANFADSASPFWWRDERHTDGYRSVSPVKSFPANQFGLYDTIGNLWEHTGDRFTYEADQWTMKGGAFTARLGWLRPPQRMWHPAYEAAHDIGFRLVRP